MFTFKTSGHWIASGALLVALSVGAASAAEDPAVVVTAARAAESQLRSKPAPNVAAAAKPAPTKAVAKAEPAEAESAPAQAGYLCVTNSCAKVAMLPMISEADQAAAAEEAAEMAMVTSVARDVAARVLGLSFTSTVGGVDEVVLTPVVDDGDEE